MAADGLSSDLQMVAEAFDLGEYEIEVYLTVLERGELTAREIAGETSVPRSRVYATARSLSDRGLVELRESRPMQIVGIDPGEAFGELRSSLSELVAALDRQYTAPPRETEVASLVKSRTTILRYLEDVIEASDNELALSLPPARLERFEPALSAAIDRGVTTTLVLTPASAAPAPEDFDYPTIASRARGRRGVTTPVLAVADGRNSIYTTQEAVRNDSTEYGVIFNRSALGFLILRFFGTVIWTTADRMLLGDDAALVPSPR